MIYTSYFRIGGKIPESVSIYPKTPPWYTGKIAKELCPDDTIFRQLKNYKIKRADFSMYYLENVLLKLDPKEILDKYDGMVLLGWSKDRDPSDCRNIFRGWMDYFLPGNVHELTPREIELGLRPS